MRAERGRRSDFPSSSVDGTSTLRATETQLDAVIQVPIIIEPQLITCHAIVHECWEPNPDVPVPAPNRVMTCGNWKDQTLDSGLWYWVHASHALSSSSRPAASPSTGMFLDAQAWRACRLPTFCPGHGPFSIGRTERTMYGGVLRGPWTVGHWTARPCLSALEKQPPAWLPGHARVVLSWVLLPAPSHF